MSNVEIFSNNGVTTVGTAFSSSSSTTFTPAAIVGGLVGLTSGQQCRVTLVSPTGTPGSAEIITVVGPVSSGSFTCSRGQEGTSANQIAWGTTTIAVVALTAGALANYPMTGDISGTLSAPTVAAIQTQAVSASAVTKGQLFGGSGAGTYGPFSVSGDVSASATTPGAFTVTQLQSQAVSATSVTKGQLFGGSGAGTYGPFSVSGDVSASATTPGAFTVTRLQSQALSASAVTKGQFLMGTAASTYGPVSITGDIAASASTAGALTVTSITGNAGALALTANAWTLAATASAFTLAQTAPSSDVATVAMNISPQAPYASASTNVVGGSLNVNLATSISGNAVPAVNILYSGTKVLQLQSFVGTSSWGAIYPGGVTPSASNYAFYCSSAGTGINAQSGASVTLYVANSARMALSSTTTTTNNAFQFNTGFAPTLNQAAPASVSSGNGTAAQATTIASAVGGASTAVSSTGGAGANLILNAAAGGAGTSTNGANGSLQFQMGGTTIWQMTPGGEVYAISAATLATSGTTTLTAAQYQYTYIQPPTVSLSGAVTLTFPSSTAGTGWILDVSNVTFGAYAITVKVGTGAAATTITSASKLLWFVFAIGANACAIV